jgi:hypothetical protein
LFRATRPESKSLGAFDKIKDSSLCLFHFIFHFWFFVSFGDEVTKINCHFQAKTVQLIFSVFGHFDQNMKNEMNRTLVCNTHGEKVQPGSVKKPKLQISKTFHTNNHICIFFLDTLFPN